MEELSIMKNEIPLDNLAIYNSLVSLLFNLQSK